MPLPDWLELACLQFTTGRSVKQDLIICAGHNRERDKVQNCGLGSSLVARSHPPWAVLLRRHSLVRRWNNPRALLIAGGAGRLAHSPME